MMQSIAQEVAEHRIRVNSIAPGAIRTPINKPAWDTPAAYNKLLELIPYKRIGEPEDIARAAVWLASDYADYVNGTTLYVDGGMTLYPGFTPMLQGAAAADLEVRAGRRLAMTRRREDFHKIGRDALAALVARLGLDRLARQCEGNEIAPPLMLGDAIAAGADLLDFESHPSQLLAGRISPTSRPTTFFTGG
jgi:hypothetical protein